MNICIDIGNTNTEIGFIDNNLLLYKQRTRTISFFSKEDIETFIDKCITNSKVNKKCFKKAILSSVVPNKNQYFISAIKELLNIDTFVISPNIKSNISLNVDNPNEVGADLLADLSEAKAKYGYPTLICDLGTATKILLIDSKGDFSSCLILPGIGLSITCLSSNTALLQNTVASLPKSIVAKNTTDAINAGVIYGHIEMLEGLVKKYEKEIGYTCKHILSGGFGAYIKDIAPRDFIFDNNLTLYGINRLGELNK